MIKARYLGYKCERLEAGKVYKISTVCRDSSLVVSCRGVKLQYHSLENFLKEWKVTAVYHAENRR